MKEPPTTFLCMLTFKYFREVFLTFISQSGCSVIDYFIFFFYSNSIINLSRKLIFDKHLQSHLPLECTFYESDQHD